MHSVISLHIRTHTHTQQLDQDSAGESSKPLFPNATESEQQEAVKKEAEVPSQGTPEASGSSKQPEE